MLRYLSSFLLFYFCCFLSSDFSFSFCFCLLLSSVFNPSSFLLSASSSSSFCYFFFFLFVICFTSFQLFYNLAFVSSTIFLCCFFLSGSSKCYFFSFVFWFSVFLSFLLVYFMSSAFLADFVSPEKIRCFASGLCKTLK